MTARMKIEASEYARLQAAESKLLSLQGEGLRKRRKLLGQVLDVFGLRDTYPDVEKVRKESRHTYDPRIGQLINLVEVPYTDLGVDKFASDLEKAAAASVGDSALKTIRKAIKEATK